LSSYRKNSNFNFQPIEQKTVLDALLKIDEKDAPGASGIESIILKHCAHSLSSSICHLFNLCIKTNQLPDEWKIAYLSPIYKGKGLKYSPDNYRPISVISPLAKCFERIIADQISLYLVEKSILHDSQNGFRATLNSMIERWKASLDISQNAIAVFLDLSKAFDTIDHELLLLKLHYYNFSQDSLNLLKNYLSNRYTITKFGGCFSKKNLFGIGVPQDSVLDPLLFIIFINEICYLLLNSELI